jgi:hypothetical protein
MKKPSFQFFGGHGVTEGFLAVDQAFDAGLKLGFAKTRNLVTFVNHSVPTAVSVRGPLLLAWRHASRLGRSLAAP